VKVSNVTLSVLCVAATVAIASLYLGLGHKDQHVTLGAAAPGVEHREGASADAPAAKLETQELDAHDATREVVTAGDADPAQSKSAPRDRADDLVLLDQKYAGASLDELIVAESRLTDKRKSELERICKLLLANDRLTPTAPQSSNDAADSKTPSDGRPASFVSQFGPDGSKSVRITREEFPEYTALEVEVWWLHNKVRKLKQAESSATK